MPEVSGIKEAVVKSVEGQKPSWLNYLSRLVIGHSEALSTPEQEKRIRQQAIGMVNLLDYQYQRQNPQNQIPDGEVKTIMSNPITDQQKADVDNMMGDNSNPLRTATLDFLTKPENAKKHENKHLLDLVTSSQRQYLQEKLTRLDLWEGANRLTVADLANSVATSVKLQSLQRPLVFKENAAKPGFNFKAAAAIMFNNIPEAEIRTCLTPINMQQPVATPHLPF